MIKSSTKNLLLPLLQINRVGLISCLKFNTKYKYRILSPLNNCSSCLNYSIITTIKQRFSTDASASPPPSPIIRRKGKGDTEQTAFFVDKRVVQVHGGNGGDGCISFTKLFMNEFAGPDGGDGGNGGHVVFEATPAAKSLSHLPAIIKGKPGGKGKASNCTGENGDHLTIPVPLGTIFKTRPVDGSIGLTKTLADLNEPSQFFIGAKGGAGGKGNKWFATAQNQSPEIAEFGGEGESESYLVEMAVIADFGLVGFPNAGKSTLLRAISRARPKVASYAFTTLKPHVGVVFFEDMERVTVADIPGLIPDAHRNRGLGIDFLRHIQRCVCLIYVIDFSDPDPLGQYNSLVSELGHFDPVMLTKSSIILANKLDTPEARENLSTFQHSFPQTFHPISAKYSFGLKELLIKLRAIVDDGKKEKQVDQIYTPVRENTANTEVTKWR